MNVTKVPRGRRSGCRAASLQNGEVGVSSVSGGGELRVEKVECAGAQVGGVGGVYHLGTRDTTHSST